MEIRIMLQKQDRIQNEIIYYVYVSSFYYTNQFLNNAALTWENVSQGCGIKVYIGGKVL